MPGRQTSPPAQSTIALAGGDVEEVPVADRALLVELERRRERAPIEFAAALAEPTEAPSLLDVEVSRVRRLLRTLRQWRAETHSRSAMSQGDVAQAMGTTQSAVARLESGLADPQITTLVRFAAACGYRLRFQLEPVIVAQPRFITVEVEDLGPDAYTITGDEPRAAVPLDADAVRGIMAIVTSHEEPAELRTELARALTGIVESATGAGVGFRRHLRAPTIRGAHGVVHRFLDLGEESFDTGVLSVEESQPTSS